MNKEKIFIGLLILIIVLSIGSIMIINHINSDDVSQKVIYEDKQSGTLKFGILETDKNSGGDK